jgi:hypothetical protein
MINVPLLRKTLEYITAHPEEHDQRNWGVKTACGSSYCLAGHAVVLAGHEIDWHSPDLVRMGMRSSCHALTDGRYISDAAREELGLDPERAARLFDANNDLGTLWRLASEYTDGEVEVPADFRL